MIFETKEMNQKNRKCIILLSLNWYRRKDPRVPLGMAYLYSALKSGIADCTDVDIKFINADVRENLSNVLHEVLVLNPSVLGMSVYAWNSEQIKHLGHSLRELGFTGTIVLGGPEITYGGQELNEEFDAADYFVKGFGEAPILEIVRKSLEGQVPVGAGIYRKGEDIGNILSNSNNEFPSSPYSHKELIPLVTGGDFLRWQTQRGCVYRCSFCAFKLPNGLTDESDLPTVEYELGKIKETGIKNVAVLDPVFFLKKERSMKVLELIRTICPEVHFNIQTRFEHLDSEIIESISTLNITLECGLQTLDPAVQKEIKRVNNKAKVLEIIRELIKKGVPFETHLIYGLPMQTFESFYSDVSTLKELGCRTVRLFPLSLLRGTEIGVAYGNGEDIHFSPMFPKEIIKSKWMGMDTLFRLKKLQMQLEDRNSLLDEETFGFLKDISRGARC